MRVRPVVAAVAAAVAACTAGSAQAAPPEGCYGFPSIPSTFLCIDEFTPGGAIPSAQVDPSGSTVTVPAFCAGQCYGPFTVPVPKVSTTPGNGEVAKFTYQGQQYTIRVGEIPDPPPVPPLDDLPPIPPIDEPPPLGGPTCRGEQLVPPTPVSCVSSDTDWQGNTTWYVGYCTTSCRTGRIPVSQIPEAVEILLCRVNPKSC